MDKFIPYGHQWIDEDDISAVIGALRSDWLTGGPKVEEFESALADYCGAEYAIAVSNGTAALHVAMLAAGVEPGDRVLTSAITFLASANCAEFVGASVDFMDIDSDNLCINLNSIKTSWRKDVKAVIPVDFSGYPCLSREISDYIHERGALVIEDGCHAIGAERDGYKIGALPWADMTCFSFHPVKTITSGEGGAILTDDFKLAERCCRFRNHGMIKKSQAMSEQEWEKPIPILAERGPWYYEMTELGFNYRITDLQCALGLSQLKKLELFIKRRKEIVDRYNQGFGGLKYLKLPISSRLPQAINTPELEDNSTPSQKPDLLRPAWHLYVLRIDFDAIGKSRTEVMTELCEAGVGTQVHYIPVYLQPYYREKYGFSVGKCPTAETYYQQCLSIPLYPALTDEEIDYVIQTIKKVLKPI